jgi:hypothetical protein
MEVTERLAPWLATDTVRSVVLAPVCQGFLKAGTVKHEKSRVLQRVPQLCCLKKERERHLPPALHAYEK